MIDQVKIGSFLRLLRKENGMSQEGIAAQFGVSSRSISRWENGNTLPSLEMLVELADYYNVDIREIINGERKGGQMQKAEKETLLRVADYADSEKKRTVHRKKVLLWILGSLNAALSIAVVCFGMFAFSRQYNAKGISSYLCVTIEENRPKEYIGMLDDYRIYTEKLKTDALYFTDVNGNSVSLTEAVAKKQISIADWRKKARSIQRTGNTEILQFENYEIAITDRECMIRPLSPIG